MIYSPSAISRPMFLAFDTPPFGICITLILSSFLAYTSEIIPDLSVEPSSMIINSNSFNVWFKTDSIVSRIYFSLLNTGMIIVIFFIFIYPSYYFFNITFKYAFGISANIIHLIFVDTLTLLSLSNLHKYFFNIVIYRSISALQ